MPKTSRNDGPNNQPPLSASESDDAKSFALSRSLPNREWMRKSRHDVPSFNLPMPENLLLRLERQQLKDNLSAAQTDSPDESLAK